jgi:hypothetical protein
VGGCEYPSYFCDFSHASRALSRGALSSAPSSDSLKHTLGLTLGVCFVDVSSNLDPPSTRGWTNVSIIEPGKVSVHLFNSVLNL